ncbi:class I SAM-dependent methyltransferase [Rhabdochlamydiaceae symbiont of Dictyostelium giganteum]|uniref:class I SAM-dependent methyltransferase n=1 Tax=Rhabdochlamydiaceae symbiont of Dictyostelium giganteum TaxID=3342349 RepID=UPI0038517366
MNTKVKYLWNAKKYADHSFVQKEAAINLLKKVQLKGSENILDIGCGDGKITSIIAKKVPNGSIIGIDISSDMIEFSRKSFNHESHPNLTFLIQDAQQFDFNATMDVIFSSFAIQWMPNPDLFFQSARKSLKPKGYLVATIPLGISTELETSIEIVISSTEWASYFYQFSPEWYFERSDNYEKLLVKNKFESIYFDNVQHVVHFSSKTSFENYIIQWFSYLQPLPQNLKQIFLDQVIDTYLKIVGPLKNGEILFSFPRIDIIATKSNL